MRGIFITLEGIEGSGKTTQIKLLAGHLKRLGLDVILTREPGGTRISDKIREILLDHSHKEMDPLAEILLYEASRAQHVSEVIRPALAKGRIILSDRFADATAAYQGAARKISAEVVKRLNTIATGGIKPDLTILLDLPPRAGLARVRRRTQRLDRFEAEKLAFHNKVRNGYLRLARSEPARVKVVKARGDVGEIHRRVCRLVECVLNSKHQIPNYK